MDSHSRIAGAPETAWITGGYGERSLRELLEFLSDVDIGPVKNLPGLHASTVIEAGRLFLDKIFETYLTAKDKDVLVLKTPDDIKHLDFLREIYPDAKFIHIHRDGRDVACSTYLQKGVVFGDQLDGFGDLTIASALKRWADWDYKVRSEFRGEISNYLNISYESLVRKPERILSLITEFMGVSFEKNMIDYACQDHEYPDWEAGSTDVRRKQAIDTTSIGQWQHQVPKQAWPLVDAEFGDYLESLGYSKCGQPPNEASECETVKKEPAVPENKGGNDSRLFVPGGHGVNLKNQVNEYFGPHRSGWAFAVQALAPAHDPNSIYLDTFLEKSFVWNSKEASAIKEPWVGFIHIPPGVPDWFMGFQSNDAMFALPQWQESLPLCRGLFTLSEYHKNSLQQKLDVPVNALMHPLEVPELQWSWERYERNANKSIVQVGWWLRVLHSIFELPETGHEKIFLRARKEDWFDALLQKERTLRKEQGLFRDSMYETARVVSFLSNIEYDRMLSENIVFVNFYDTSANNAIIECIARNTPILVNPLDAVVEYLGEDYPLYYQSLEEAAEKAKDPSLIHAAHQYLKVLPLKVRLSGDYFRESLLNSEILQSLSNTSDPGIETFVANKATDRGPGTDNAVAESASDLNQRGEACFKLGDLEQANDCFLQAVKSDPANVDGYNNLGVLCWRQGDVATALDHFATGLGINADHAELISNTAAILKAIDKPQDAQALCEGYLARNPEDDGMRDVLRDLNELLGCDGQSSVTDSAHGQDPRALNEQGEQAYAQGDITRAEAFFDQAYALDPNNVDVCNNLAVVHWQAMNPDKAVIYLLRALEIDSCNKDVVINGGEMLAALGKQPEAEALCSAFLAQYPDDVDVAQLMSSLNTATQAVPEAAGILKEPGVAAARPLSRRDIVPLDYSDPVNADRAPEISVVISSLDQGEFLEKAILSVLDQEYPGLELVVMDGGSSDDSVEIIERYADRISYWKSEPGEGHYRAVQEGFSHCNGEFMTWLDANDILLPNALENVASVFAQCPHVEWLTGIPATVDEAGEMDWTYPRAPVYCQDFYLKKHWAFPHPIQKQGTFWLRALWDKAGSALQADLNMSADLELWARFFRSTPLYTLNEILAGSRQNFADKGVQEMSPYHKEVDSILEREIEVLKASGKSLIPAMPPLRIWRGSEHLAGPEAGGLVDSGQNVVVDNARLVIATSIAPKGLERQKRAIQSWIYLGIEVISLNIQKEIDLLEDEFPGVRFVQAKRNGSKIAGKPYVYIDDMLAALANTGSQIVGIVNSDIILRANQAVIDKLCREAAGSFLYGSRIDIAHAETTVGELYYRGVDFFFFDRSLVQKKPAADYMLGMPWWDWWLPISALRAGMPAKRIDSPLGYHVRHELNYNNEHMTRFANVFLKTFKDETFADLYRENISKGGSLQRHAMTIMADLAAEHLSRNSQRLRLPVPGSENESRALGERHAPKVTAIVSTYASESHIENCLNDLVNQSIADQIEIIVIDAASPQNERDVVQRFQEHYPNIHYRRTEERIGIYEAWNLAIKEARGEYLVTCSTNDRLRNDACEILARTLDDDPDIALTYGNSLMTKVPYESFDNPTLFNVYVWPKYSYESLTDRCLVGPHPMWRRSVHDSVGYFDESFVALGDQEFWLRLGQKYDMRALPDFTGLYYVSESSITGDSDLTQSETDKIHAQYRWRHRYGQWFNKRCERNVHQHRIADGPLAQIILVAKQLDGDRLADTLDSVVGQFYENWHLTVVSGNSCPDPLFEREPRLDWVQYSDDQPLGKVLNLVAQVCQPEWLCVMDAGERLDPAFLSESHDYFQKYPEWKLVYCDDDRVDVNKDLFDPRFKPDFNLELLRGSDYIGNAVLVTYSALLEAGGFEEQNDAVLLDLIFRVHDQSGSSSIGHLADIRFHRNDSDALDGQDQLSAERKQTVQRHLQRCGESASIDAASLPGTFMLNYSVDRWPAVSILVVATDKGNHLQSCLQAVLNRTDYPEFELRVLDRTEDDSRLKAYLSRLGAGDSRVSVIPATGRDEVQNLNHFAQGAKGEYLLWLNEEVVPVQEIWLQRLVQQGVRKSVGIVGARIVNRSKAVVSGGIILGTGTRGIGARCHQGLHVTSPGYMGRAQLAQEMGAVPGLCMLVRKNLFEAEGGYNRHFPINLYRDIDLCLHIRQKEKIIVWTPFSTLIYLGEAEDVDGRAYDEAKLKKQVEYFQERWLPLIASDPSHNRNLSMLRTDFTPEIQTVRGWDPEIDDKPRVLSFGAGSYGSWQYRVNQPLDAMDRLGELQRTHTPFIGRKIFTFPSVADLQRLQPDSTLMHNTMHDDAIEAMERYKLINKAFIVFGLDDLMTALPAKNPYSKTVYKDMNKRIRKCLSLADRLLVTTEPLAQALSGMAEDIQVVPNYLDSELWAVLESQRGTGTKPRVGWAGAQQHLGDLELLAEVVRETANEVDWIFFGMCPEFLRPFVKEAHQAVSFEEYPQKLASLNLDLAVAPLEHNRFNECKSNLRILEYGILGWPVIASDVVPYRDAPAHRVANQPSAWINAIREHVHDLEACRKSGDVLREWVRSNWLLHQHVDEWLKALSPEIDSGLARNLHDKAAGL